jgi:hypothetical protein
LVSKESGGSNSNGYVNKTFRLHEDHMRKLEAEAKNANMSTNGLIVSILERYLEWGKYADVVRFVSLPPNMVDGILANVTEKQMADAGTYIAEKSLLQGPQPALFPGLQPDAFRTFGCAVRQVCEQLQGPG